MSRERRELQANLAVSEAALEKANAAADESLSARNQAEASERLRLSEIEQRELALQAERARLEGDVARERELTARARIRKRRNAAGAARSRSLQAGRRRRSRRRRSRRRSSSNRRSAPPETPASTLRRCRTVEPMIRRRRNHIAAAPSAAGTAADACPGPETPSPRHHACRLPGCVSTRACRRGIASVGAKRRACWSPRSPQIPAIQVSWINLSGFGNVEPYVPHYYLGVVLLKRPGTTARARSRSSQNLKRRRPFRRPDSTAHCSSGVASAKRVNGPVEGEMIVATPRSTPFAAARLALAALLAVVAFSILALSCDKSTDPDTEAALASVNLSTNSVIGGTNVPASVTLTLPAPSGGASVSLSSSNGGAATVPATVVVPANTAGADYIITTAPVITQVDVTISGVFKGLTRNAVLTVRPVPAVRAEFTFGPLSDTIPHRVSARPHASTTRAPAISSAVSSMPARRHRILGSRATPGSSPAQPTTVSGIIVSDPIVPCGTFAAVVDRVVTLTVTAPQGTNAVSKTITFQKVNEC